MKILIIEDEKLTAKDLARTITGLDPDAEIVAMLSSVEESVVFLQASPAIDLIFSDIQLGDGLSFEIF
jgi:two-component system, LytTR family, response regulator LytT